MTPGQVKRAARNEQVVAAWLAGESDFAVIGSRFGLGESRVLQLVKAAVPPETWEARRRNRGGWRPSVEQQEQIRVRDAEIVALWRAGVTQTAIGAKFGMTRERARQIITAAVDPAELAAGRHGSPAWKLSSISAEQQAAIEARHHTFNAMAAEMGVPVKSLQRAGWTPRNPVSPFQAPPSGRATCRTTEDRLAEMRARYSEYLATSPASYSIAAFAHWCGSTSVPWYHVLRRAGLTTGEFVAEFGIDPAAAGVLSTRRTDAIPPEVAEQVVVDFVAAMRQRDLRPTARLFVQWSEETNPAVRTTQTIRAVLGMSWSQALALAYARMKR